MTKNSGNKDKGQTTENETKPVINKMSKDELKKCVKDVSENNPLGMAGIFHIFGNEVDSSSHIAGNIATDKMNGAGDFGSADGATQALKIFNTLAVSNNTLTNLTVTTEPLSSDQILNINL